MRLATGRRTGGCSSRISASPLNQSVGGVGQAHVEGHGHSIGDTAVVGGLGGLSCARGRRTVLVGCRGRAATTFGGVAGTGQLLDPVDPAEGRPPSSDRRPVAEREAREAPVVPKVREGRLHPGEAVPVLRAALRRVHAPLQLSGEARGASRCGAVEDHCMERLGPPGRAQMASARRTRQAFALRPARVRAAIATDHESRALEIARLARGAHAGAREGIVGEVLGLVEHPARLGSRLVVRGIRPLPLARLRRDACVKRAHAGVRNERRPARHREGAEVRPAAGAGIRGEQRLRGRVRGEGRNGGRQQLLLPPGAARLRARDELRC
jgi:hypothetical protein